jgi:DNA-binding GntR family transcriptional regulator
MYRIETEALGKQVHKALRIMIINGELQPGQKLIQDDLAKHLGVSRTPLLSAFSKLEQENLLITVPRRGAYVKKYTDKELLDICNIRIRLEALGAKEAALAATPENISQLESTLKAFDNAIKKGDKGLIRQTDYNYHMEILRTGGNKFLFDILYSYIVIAINMDGLMTYVEQSKTEHHEIFDAISGKDAKKAESIMIKHIKRPYQYLNPTE